MLAELIVEKFKKREREIGREKGLAEGRTEGRVEGRTEGRVETQRAWQAWYERMQAAQRDGQPFNEPPPGYSPEARGNGSEPSDA